MKKLWVITFSGELAPDIQKKIRRVIKAHHSIGRPQNCLFCGTETTWTINDEPVCPKCAVKYKFLGEQWLLDPCEVCGRQGEWATDGDPQHFLCHIHLNDWFKWKIPELDYIDSKRQPDKWHQAWGEGWSKFINFEKEKLSV